MKPLAPLTILTALTLASSSAQSHRTLGTAADVAGIVAQATGEVLLATDVLRTEAVAEALRQAMVVRGVPVFVLVPPAAAEENASYVAGLAHAGAAVRLSEVAGSFLVVDRRYTVAGPLIGGLGEAAGQVPTIIVDDPSFAARFVEGFRQSFAAAQPYTPLGR